MISAILLCVEESKKLRQPKALLTLESKTFVRQAIEQIFKSGVEELIIVTGAYQKEVEIEVRKFFDSLVRLSKIKLVHNEDYRAGKMGSIQKGLKAVSSDKAAFFISLVDLPFLSSQNYRDFIRKFTLNEKKLIRGRFKGDPSHPVLISTQYKKEILSSPVDDNSCAFLFKKYPTDIAWCELDSAAGTSLNIKNLVF